MTDQDKAAETARLNAEIDKLSAELPTRRQTAGAPADAQPAAIVQPRKKTRRPAGRRDFPYSAELSSVIAGGAEDANGLLEEMTEWKDSLENNSMEHLPKYDEVQECVDALENAINGELDSIDVPEFLTTLTVHYTQDTRTSAQSRAGRLDNAVTMLQAAHDAIEGWLDEHPALEADDPDDIDEDGGSGEDGSVITEADVDERETQRTEAEELRDALDNAISSLGDVSFPGMY